MTILITGAGGFLGGHICRRLRARGQPVRGFDIAWSGERYSDDVTGSILEPEQLAEAFRGVTGVIHAAALAHLWTPGRFDYDRVNTFGTCRILAEARRAGVKTVYVSSYTTLIGRDHADGSSVDETVEITPNRLCGRYPRSKRQAELFAQTAAEAGQHACIVQPTAPVGTGDHNLTPPSAMIRDLATGRIPALLECALDLVDVEAVASATIAALEHGRTGHRYLLSGETVMLSDLAHQIAEISGTPAPKARVPLWVASAAARVEAGLSHFTKRAPKAPLTGVRLAARKARFSSEKARSELGFAPRPITQILPDATRWITRHHP